MKGGLVSLSPITYFRIAGLLLGLWLIVGGLGAVRRPGLVVVGAKQQIVPSDVSGNEMPMPVFVVSRKPQVLGGMRLAAGVGLCGWIVIPLVREIRKRGVSP